MMPTKPEFLRKLLDECPQASNGVHRWVFTAARQLHHHLRPQEIFNLLKDRVRNCGRHVPDSEIWDAIKNSMECAWQPSGKNSAPVPSASKWPTLNKVARDVVLRDGDGLVGLWEESRVVIDSNESKTEWIIDALFPGNPLLCCGVSQAQFETGSREEWRGKLSALQFIVPSPMTDTIGLTKDGRESAHTLNNTGPRRFLVVEFDSGTTDEHATLLLHLATFAPMVCALHSGGKSMHGWFFIQGQPEDKVLRFFKYAVTLGADRATWTRSQFVRMPDGQRDNGARQTVYFLNFRPMEVLR